MSNDLWRWADPNGQQRNVRLDELRAALAGGLIAPNTPVWRSGWPRWQPAHEVPELTSASLGGANGVVLNIPPPPLAMLAVQQEYEAASGSIAPAPPGSRAEDEPPPPPAYVPLPAKAPSMPSPSLKTQIGGSDLLAPRAPTTSGSPSSEPGPRLGPSLPTTIGVPPPPELLARAAVGPTVPNPPGLGAASETIEEVSASFLVDSSSAIHGHGPSSPIGRPIDIQHERGAPSREFASDSEIAGLPGRPGLRLILDDLAAIREGRPPKNKLLIAVLGVVALCLLMTLVAGIASIANGRSSANAKMTAASASASAETAPSGAIATTTGATAAAPIPPPPPPTEMKSDPRFQDCTAAGNARTIAPRGVIASGVEVRALDTGLAIGFAASPRNAVAMSLDPSSLAPGTTVRTRTAGGDARRVTPLLVDGRLAAFADVDRKGDRIASRRVVATSTLLDVGFADDAIVWAPRGKNNLEKLFSVEGEGPVEALRAVPLSDQKGIAITFRRGKAIHIGVAMGDTALAAEGALSTIAGLGQVGSPTIAVSGEHVMAAWADREGASDSFQIRWTTIKIGSSTTEATPFTVPEGGLGDHAMSPSLASLGGGRFLLAWTEGPVSNHQVRAITIDADGSTSGSPIAVSASGLNAGQPSAVVGRDGLGAVAFLVAKGKALEVHAVPVRCSAH